MKKSMLFIVLVVLCATVLTGCFCKHETWQNADCENPKTCDECGKTEGEPLGHNWINATCTAPKTCLICEKTEGDALGHTWVDATCETAKTCTTCAKTEGEALGHAWKDATTEAPKTCATCAKTEGERIITDPRFTTAACQPLFGSWILSVPITGDMMELDGFTGVLNVSICMDFSNDGKLSIYTKIDKPEEFKAGLKQYITDQLYTEFKAQGLNKEASDAAMQAAYGMTVEEYADAFLEVIDFSAMFEMIEMEGFYYVDGNNLYAATSWDEEMEPTPFYFQGEQLMLDELTEELGVAAGGFVRVTDGESA